MTDEEKLGVSGEAVDSTDYITAIKELKEKTVDKEQYLKLKEENRKLLNAFVDGSGNPNVETTQVQKEDLEDLKVHLNTEGISNLDYVETALKIRNRVLEEDGKDLFCPMGTQYLPTDEDKASAERVAKELQEMVDLADGDNDVFQNEFQRRVIDVTIPKKGKRS